MPNLAHDFPKAYRQVYKTEELNGVIIMIAPSPSVPHGETSSSIEMIFRQYLKGKNVVFLAIKLTSILQKAIGLCPMFLLFAIKTLLNTTAYTAHLTLL